MITLLTMYNNAYGELAALTNRTKRTYADRHDYLFLSICTDESPLWEPIKQAAKLLPTLEWICLTGADWFITNPAITLETLTQPNPVDFIATQDVNGFNDGFLLVRNSPWSLGFLAKWYASRDRMGNYTNAEQTACMGLLYREPKEKWAILPQRACNSYLCHLYDDADQAGQWEAGDFALHLPGLPMETRLQQARNMIG